MNDEQPKPDDLLSFLQGLVGQDEERKKIVCGAAGAGKTPQELYAEEMRLLQQGGSNQGGREQLRAAINQASRGIRGRG